jgi:hypothetical protein
MIAMIMRLSALFIAGYYAQGGLNRPILVDQFRKMS